MSAEEKAERLQSVQGKSRDFVSIYEEEVGETAAQPLKQRFDGGRSIILARFSKRRELANEAFRGRF